MTHFAWTGPFRVDRVARLPFMTRCGPCLQRAANRIGPIVASDIV